MESLLVLPCWPSQLKAPFSFVLSGNPIFYLYSILGCSKLTDRTKLEVWPREALLSLNSTGVLL